MIANLLILETGKTRTARFSTLSAICDVLDCQPGVLLTNAANEREAAETSRTRNGPTDRPHLQE